MRLNERSNRPKATQLTGGGSPQNKRLLGDHTCPPQNSGRPGNNGDNSIPGSVDADALPIGYATLTIAADSKHLGARIGITAVLHTWGSAIPIPPPDGFEHVAHVTDLCCQHVANDVAAEMHHAALPASLGQVPRGALDQAAARSALPRPSFPSQCK
jgi:hypothetical protein